MADNDDNGDGDTIFSNPEWWQEVIAYADALSQQNQQNQPFAGPVISVEETDEKVQAVEQQTGNNSYVRPCQKKKTLQL